MKIAFTGQRPKDLVGYDEAKYQQFLTQLENILARYGEHTEFICGGAQGFDQLAFEAALRLKRRYPDVKIHLYVPFRGQESQWLAHGYFSQDMYNRQKNSADTVKYISDITSGSDYSAIVKAMYARNEAMVRDADIVIALYSQDDWRTHKGGTSSCMRYAYGKKPIYQLKFTKDNGVLLCSGEPTLIQ